MINHIHTKRTAEEIEAELDELWERARTPGTRVAILNCEIALLHLEQVRHHNRVLEDVLYAIRDREVVVNCPSRY